MYKSSARISLHLLPGFEFLKIKSVLYDTDNTPKNVPAYVNFISTNLGLDINKPDLNKLTVDLPDEVQLEHQVACVFLSL